MSDKEPGYYRDGRGDLRFWDGSSWTDYVRQGSYGWAEKKGIPVSNVPYGSPEGPRQPPPGVRVRPPQNSAPSPSTGLGGCLIILAVAGFLMVEAVKAVGEAFRELRWPLLVAWVVLTVPVVLAIRTRLREGGGRWLRLTVIWLAIGGAALLGFQIEREEAKHRVPPEITAIELARNKLSHLAHYKYRSSWELACKHYFIGKSGEELAALYGEPDCPTTVEKIMKGLPEEFKDDPESVVEKIPMTIVGKRDLELYDWCYRIELGPNPLSWREIEICREPLTGPNLLRVLKLADG